MPAWPIDPHAVAHANRRAESVLERDYDSLGGFTDDDTTWQLTLTWAALRNTTVGCSLGQDRRWRRFVVDAVDPRPGQKVLDLAAGTGTSSQPLRLPIMPTRSAGSGP